MKVVIFSVALMALGASCGDDGTQPPVHDAHPVVDAAVDASTTACFAGTPTTHEQIINACTNAQEIFKDTHPPLQHADGSLPALPP
ncbi:MAG: hypothetical protein IPQ07_19695 [Myxococcales bacterium]|nr:hypothetical protein [Myxococcales bacterium]